MHTHSQIVPQIQRPLEVFFFELRSCLREEGVAKLFMFVYVGGGGPSQCLHSLFVLF